MRPQSGKPIIPIIIGALIGLWMILTPLINIFIDYHWFKELNLLAIFKTSLITKIAIGIIAGIVAFIAIYTNIIVANQISKRSESFKGFSDNTFVQFYNAFPFARFLLLAAALVVSFLLGSGATILWEQYLKFSHAALFGVTDPLFGKDISFYVFRLPFLSSLYSLFVVVLLISIAGAVVSYFLQRNIGFDGRSVQVSSGPKNHVLLLVGLLFLSLYFYFQLKMYGMVSTPGGIANGAGYSQVKIEIPFLNILKYVSIVAALMTWATVVLKNNYKPLLGAVILLIAGVIVSKGATSAVQKFVVGPNELTKEAPYIQYTIANTRLAFGLDKIESKAFVPTTDLNAEALVRNEPTLDNIRLWDHAPLLTTFSQLQEIRTYYEFLDVDNDRYFIDGKYRQVMLSPRELVPASLPSRSWINEHLTYTHGYGVCMGPVNSITPEGLPDFFIKNIPPVSTIEQTVSRPEIYYGESDAGYAIVKTGAKEFDYPSGTENIYSNYSGTGGIEINSFIKKALFALHFKELKILLRGDIGKESRILFNREILTRISKAAPFLKYDSDPYIVVSKEGRLLWMLDGYTVTSAYPYAAQINGIGNYMRNSVKAVIDAYNGSITFYLWDDSDPIIKVYDKMFPGVFKPMSQMPEDVRNHVRYPQTMFTVQAKVYSTYHMTDPQVFYNKEDVWRIPASISNANESMSPYYTVMKLAGVGDKEEFILMVPFCPSKKENMIAWLAARCDGSNYGKLLVFDFPKQKLVYGPTQIESRINQDAEISKQLTLWNQGGSRVIRGSLLVIPVEQSLLYVQPLYIASQSGGVPELKRVIVAYENTIAMEETLKKSLARIFGTDFTQSAKQGGAVAMAVSSVSTGQGDVPRLIQEADRQFRVGQEELRKGNWSGYGEAMKRVGKTLEELSKTAK
jgi:uncharacterized membrane protein (UPF0182 family)